MEASTAEVVRLTGTTSRTLRYYDATGLLRPSRIGAGGLRYYDGPALQRLQRILLLRRAGLGLRRIGELLDGGISDIDALREHVADLHAERSRIDRQIAALDRTIAAADEGRWLMAEEMLDGFDNSAYRQEVEQRWGEQAYARSADWWSGLGDAARADFLEESAALAGAWIGAHAAGLPIDSDAVQSLVARHIAWIGRAWGGVEPASEQIVGLAQMYPRDERFAASYGGVEGARYVRDALIAAVSSQAGDAS